MREFAEKLFDDYWSMNENRFNSRCIALGKNPQKIKSFLLMEGVIKEIDCSIHKHYQIT